MQILFSYQIFCVLCNYIKLCMHILTDVKILSNMFLTFNIVRLCFNIGAQPIHLNFKANSTPIVIKASNSTEPCTHTGT